MNAYDSLYLSDVQARMGSMLDVAVNAFGMALEPFYQLFLASRYANCLTEGQPTTLVGRSGAEIAAELAESHNIAEHSMQTPIRTSKEYWVGWALSFFQWASGRSFSSINECVTIGDILAMYDPYHEMDIRQFCDAMDELCTQASPHSELKQARLSAGLSQSQLALLANVPLRTLQQYEQQQKDINRARAEYVLALAKALHVAPESLLEHKASDSYEYAITRF